MGRKAREGLYVFYVVCSKRLKFVGHIYRRCNAQVVIIIMSSERTLVIRGIPATWTATEVELFFDNGLHCSDGCVENVELSAGTGTALVTFEHARGNYSADFISLHTNFGFTVK